MLTYLNFDFSHCQIDFDPEDFERKNPDSDISEDEDTLSAFDKAQRAEEKKLARAHYVEVGKSKLRKQNDDGILLDEKRYKGSKISREQLYKDDSEINEDQDDSEEDEDESENENENESEEEEEEDVEAGNDDEDSEEELVSDDSDSEHDILSKDSDDDEELSSESEEEESDQENGIFKSSSTLNESNKNKLKELLKSEQKYVNNFLNLLNYIHFMNLLTFRFFIH